MKNGFKIAILLTLTAVAGCGKIGNLEPRAGKANAVVAYGAEKPLSAEELTATNVQARPSRSVELLRRSERRAEDPFDLPPGSESKGPGAKNNETVSPIKQDSGSIPPKVR
jgi:predicted small lipoprotein YifL